MYNTTVLGTFMGHHLVRIDLLFVWTFIIMELRSSASSIYLYATTLQILDQNILLFFMRLTYPT